MKKFRTLFTLILALFLLAAAGCGGGKETKKEEGRVLNIFSWADNFNPEVIKEFEKKYDCKVNYDVFANNEELLAKLQAGGAQYDVIQPSDYMVTTMKKLGLLEKLDKSKMPNTEFVMDKLKKNTFDPNGEYSVVYRHHLQQEIRQNGSDQLAGSVEPCIQGTRHPPQRQP